MKVFAVEGLGKVQISKRADARHLRLRLGANGDIKVTIPRWTPYAAGLVFVRSKTDWITANRPEPIAALTDGVKIGKAHRLQFETAAIDKPFSRISGSSITVVRPLGMAVHHPAVQTSADKACRRALRSEAASLLPQRLRQLADQYDFHFGKVAVKQLKGRWGSCDQHQDIVLNLFLMQLPWPLIDYVLLHELVHTKHLNHGAEFWAEFERHQPRAKHLRKLVKTYQPTLTPT